MAVFITLGDTDELQIRVPIDGQTGWGPQLIEEFVRRLVEHDHSGVDGRGVAITGAGLAIDSVDGARLRLLNNQFLRARNAADSGDVNIVKINADNEIEFGAPFASVLIAEATIDALSSNTADIDNLLKQVTTASNPLEVAPNNAVTTTSVIVCSSTQVATLSYKIERGGLYQSGSLECIGSTNVLSEEFTGPDLGVTFTLSTTNELIITTTDNVDDATITYTIDRR